MSWMGSILCRPARRNFTTCPVGHETWLIVQVLGLALLIPACGDDGDKATDGASGQATGDATGGGGSTGGSTGGGATGSTGDPGYDVGPNFGLLNFTYYPATASGLPEELGMAGVWRTEALSTEDFFAVQAWSMHLPPPPADPDTAVYNEIPSPYDWGKADTWISAGNALELRTGETKAAACLFKVEDTFPIYYSDDADTFDPACAPDPTRWVPGATYDLVAFGGDAWDDVVVPAAIASPAALMVTSPDVATSLVPLDRTKDLALAWQSDAPADRVIVRLIDMFGQVVSAHAVDDGAFTIPTDLLKKLTPGPATLTIAREVVRDIPLPTGTLRVVTRYEIWADPDLL